VSALGEEFRSAREARGLSLSDVAERLHIRSVYLAAIEDEDWHVIGAPVYVRGFMRTYARFLGLDPEAAVARFSAAVPPGTPAASTPRPAATPPPGEKAGAERTGPSLAAVLAVVVAVVAVLFVAYEFYQYRAGTPEATPLVQSSPAPAGDVAAPVTEATGDTSDVAAAAPAALPAAPAVARPGPKRGLTVRVTEMSWLRVAVDGTVVYEGILPAGATKSFAGKAADVRVGNAGGVRIAVNGRTLGPLGASGDVVERQFVLSGK
jgi:cytoskeletal protein RodZ